MKPMAVTESPRTFWLTRLTPMYQTIEATPIAIADRVDDRDGRRLDRLVHRRQPRQPERPRRLGHRHRLHDRLLLRADRTGMRRLLPALDRAQRAELRARRRAAVRRVRDARVRL